MKILEIEITNNKRLRVFKKVLNGENLEISGDTATGKTTAISALWEIIEKQGDCLTHGETKGCLRVKLGDGGGKRYIIAERTLTKSGGSITITNFDGDMPTKTTVADFKRMLSDLSVNPHKIMEMGPTARVAAIVKAADIDIDLKETEEKIAKAEDLRLAAFRKAESIDPGEEPEKVEPLSTADLISERDRLETHNRKHKDLLDRSEYYDASHERISEQRDQVNREIQKLEQSLSALKTKSEDLGIKLQENIEERDRLAAEAEKMGVCSLADVYERIASIDATNKKAAAWSHWDSETKRYEQAKENHLELFRAVNILREIKKDALDRAKWPIKGLSIDNGEIFYQGCKLENLGESEQMLVTSALAIGDIEKHPLKIVRMDGVESMSKKDFKAMQALFNGRGIQVLSTRVSRGEVEPDELTIIDGVYIDDEE